MFRMATIILLVLAFSSPAFARGQTIHRPYNDHPGIFITHREAVMEVMKDRADLLVIQRDAMRIDRQFNPLTHRLNMRILRLNNAVIDQHLQWIMKITSTDLFRLRV